MDMEVPLVTGPNIGEVLLLFAFASEAISEKLNTLPAVEAKVCIDIIGYGQC